MKRWIAAVGVVLILAAIGISVADSRANTKRWLENYHATSECKKEDEDFFRSALSRSGSGSISDQRKAEFFSRIGSCRILRQDGNPIVKAFDKNFSEISEKDKLSVLLKMSDPTGYFTRRALNGDPKWSSLDIKRISEFIPLISEAAKQRQIILEQKYRPQFQKAEEIERSFYIASIRKLENLRLPENIREYQAGVSEMATSLTKLAQIYAITQAKKEVASSANLKDAAESLRRSSRDILNIASQKTYSNFVRETIALGPSVTVSGSLGHYYIGTFIPGRPMGPVLFHSQSSDQGSLVRAIPYRAWVRAAEISEVVSPAQRGQWVFTYEIASSDEVREIESLIQSSGKLIESARQLAGVLNEGLIAKEF